MSNKAFHKAFLVVPLALIGITIAGARFLTWSFDTQTDDTISQVLIVGESQMMDNGSVVVVGTANRAASDTSAPGTWSGGVDTEDLFVATYDSSGSRIDWAVRNFQSHHGTNSTLGKSDYGHQVAVDSNSGNIYAAGWCTVDSSFKAFVTKYSSSLGSPVDYLMNNSLQEATWMDIKVANGYLYFAATTDDGTDRKLVLTKLSLSNLTEQTGYPVNYTIGDNDHVMGLAVSGDNVYVGVQKVDSLTHNDGYQVVCYDDSGSTPSLLWHNDDSDPSNASATAVGIDIDHADEANSEPNVVIGGYSGLPGGRQFCLSKLAYDDGTAMYEVLDTMGYHDNRAVGLRTAADGSVFIGGDSNPYGPANGRGASQDFLVAKYNHSNGSRVNVGTAGTANTDVAGGFTLDGNDEPWLSGKYSASSTFYASTAKFTSGAAYQSFWSHAVTGAIGHQVGTIAADAADCFTFGVYGDGSYASYWIEHYVQP